MYDLDINPMLYGSSVTCDAEAEGVAAKLEFYHKSYEAGEIMLNIAIAAGSVVLAIFFAGFSARIYELVVVSEAVLPIEDAMDSGTEAVRNTEGTFV